MIKIKIEDIVFWLLVLAVIGIIIWKLFGSPTDLAIIISVASILTGAELLMWRIVWKNYYELDKKAEVGFSKVKSEISLLKNDMNHHLNNMNKRLDNIETLIKKIKWK